MNRARLGRFIFALALVRRRRWRAIEGQLRGFVFAFDSPRKFSASLRLCVETTRSALEGVHGDLLDCSSCLSFTPNPTFTFPHVSHKSALIAWGAFYFRTNSSRGKWKIVDDDDLKYVHPPRKDSIGAQSAPYGPARVEVYDKAGSRLPACAKTEVANHCWLPGLKPDTEYTYKVFVKERGVGGGRALGLVGEGQRARPGGDSYDNRFLHQSRSRLCPPTLSLRRDRRFRRRREARIRRRAGSSRSRTRLRRTVDTRGRPVDAHDRRQHLRARTRLLGIRDRRQRRRRRRLVLHLLPAVSLCDQP